MANIKQIENFKSKYLRMAGFVEYVQPRGDRFATDFGGMRPFCRNIGPLSQQVGTKNMKKVGISS